MKYASFILQMLIACQLGMAGVAAGTHEIPGPVTAVAEHNGLPTLMIDGKPHAATPFTTYVPRQKYFEQFSAAGTDIFCPMVNVGSEPYWHTTPVWVGERVWDYSEFEETVGMILAANPDALLMPRIHIAEPEWWRQKYPDDLVVFDDGQRRTTSRFHPYRLWPAKKSRRHGTIASGRWRRDLGMSLRRLLRHIHESDYAQNIVGYKINGLNTEEWYYFLPFGREGQPGSQLGDYSQPNLERFRGWLKKKYGSNKSLRAAWNQEDVTLNSATIPTIAQRAAGQDERPFRDPSREMNVIDFYQFYNELIPETIDFFAGIIKKETQGRKAVGTFYAYLFEFSGRYDTGHMAVEKLLQSDNIDFISVTASYGKRLLGGGGSILRSPHTSLRLHGKLWKEDNDTVSFLFPKVSRQIGDNEWERSKVVFAATDTPEQSRWIYLRGAGFALGNGVDQVMFDLHGGYFDDPRLMAAVAEINTMSNRSASHDRTSVAEVLVVADEVSTFYTTMNCALLRQNLYDPPYRMIKMGTPYDCIYVNDLSIVDMSRYKLVIFLNAFHLTADQRAVIKQQVITPGRTILWCSDVGQFSGAESTPEVLAEMTGINLVRSPNAALGVPQIKLKANTGGFTDPLVDSESGVMIGPDQASCYPVAVRDPQAKSLGVSPHSGEPNLAEKIFDGTRSVYAITASLPSRFYRELARSAGVHIYNDRDDTLYVSHDYLTVNADGAGVRSLKFPHRVNIYDAVNEESLANDVLEFDLSLQDMETRIIRLER